MFARISWLSRVAEPQIEVKGILKISDLFVRKYVVPILPEIMEDATVFEIHNQNGSLKAYQSVGVYLMLRIE